MNRGRESENITFFLHESIQKTSLFHQFVIGPHLLDVARFHHGDFVVIFNDVQAVNGLNLVGAAQ